MLGPLASATEELHGRGPSLAFYRVTLRFFCK
jgi:hypothetical protein